MGRKSSGKSGLPLTKENRKKEEPNTRSETLRKKKVLRSGKASPQIKHSPNEESQSEERRSLIETIK